MLLSKEQLEKIKKSKKTKSLRSIMREEKSKKYVKHKFSDTATDDEEEEDEDEDDDQNFISEQDGENQETKKNEVILEDKDDDKFTNKIEPVVEQIRSLDRATIIEVKVEREEQQQVLKDSVDVWDSQTQEISESASESLEHSAEEYESFIHQIKTGHGQNKTMSQVDLGEDAEKIKIKRPTSFLDKLRIKALSSDHGSRGGGGISF